MILVNRVYISHICIFMSNNTIFCIFNALCKPFLNIICQKVTILDVEKTVESVKNIDIQDFSDHTS